MDNQVTKIPVDITVYDTITAADRLAGNKTINLHTVPTDMNLIDAQIMFDFDHQGLAVSPFEFDVVTIQIMFNGNVSDIAPYIEISPVMIFLKSVEYFPNIQQGTIISLYLTGIGALPPGWPDPVACAGRIMGYHLSIDETLGGPKICDAI